MPLSKIDLEDLTQALKNNPGMVFIPPSQKLLFTLLPTGELMCISGYDFSTMSDTEINELVQKYLKKAQ